MRCGATAGFKYFALQQPGAITVRVRGKGQGTMEVRTAPDGAVIAAVSVFQKPVWRSFTADITSAVDGVHALYFTYNGEGFVDFDSFTLHE